METHIVIYITSGNTEEAENIAAGLVKEGLAACVNIVPSIKSIYKWKGEICSDNESLLIAKSRKGYEAILELSSNSYLINKKIVKPENILAMTFTNKAAGEMKSRVESLLNDSQLSISIGTFHSICARFLRDQIHHIGYSPQFNIYDTKDQADLLKIVLSDRGVLRDYSSPKEVLRKISFFKNKFIFPNEAREQVKTQKDNKIIDI